MEAGGPQWVGQSLAQRMATAVAKAEVEALLRAGCDIANWTSGHSAIAKLQPDLSTSFAPNWHCSDQQITAALHRGLFRTAKDDHTAGVRKVGGVDAHMVRGA